MNKGPVESRPEPSPAGVAYGDLIYWITILGTVLTLIGTLISFITTNNYIQPSYLLSVIWQGQSVEQIWQGGAGSVPNGHWYLDHLSHGDGLTMAGIALGVFSVLPAILVASWVMLREKQQIFAVLAVLAAFITLFSLIP